MLRDCELFTCSHMAAHLAEYSPCRPARPADKVNKQSRGCPHPYLTAGPESWGVCGTSRPPAFHASPRAFASLPDLQLLARIERLQGDGGGRRDTQLDGKLACDSIQRQVLEGWCSR